MFTNLNGSNYIVNISRDALDKAKKLWSKSYVIEVIAPIELLEKRLSDRKRESIEEVRMRLERAKNAPKVTNDAIIDASNSDVSLAGKQLLDFIEKSL